MKYLVQATFAILIAFGLMSAYQQFDERQGGEIVANEPGRNVQISGQTARAVIHYRREDEVLHLQVLIISNDPEDEIIQTSVRLTEGQSHGIIVAAEDEETPGEGFKFRREGGIIFARAIPVPADSGVTSARSRSWF